MRRLPASTAVLAAELAAIDSKKVLIPQLSGIVKSPSSCHFSDAEGYLRGGTSFEKRTSHEQTTSPELDTWLSVLPVEVAIALDITASASRPEKDGPYLFGPQLINLRNEIEKKFYKAL